MNDVESLDIRSSPGTMSTYGSAPMGATPALHILRTNLCNGHFTKVHIKNRTVTAHQKVWNVGRTTNLTVQDVSIRTTTCYHQTLPSPCIRPEIV